MSLRSNKLSNLFQPPTVDSKLAELEGMVIDMQSLTDYQRDAVEVYGKLQTMVSANISIQGLIDTIQGLPRYGISSENYKLITTSFNCITNSVFSEEFQTASFEEFKSESVNIRSELLKQYSYSQESLIDTIVAMLKSLWEKLKTIFAEYFVQVQRLEAKRAKLEKTYDAMDKASSAKDVVLTLGGTRTYLNIPASAEDPNKVLSGPTAFPVLQIISNKMQSVFVAADGMIKADFTTDVSDVITVVYTEIMSNTRGIIGGSKKLELVGTSLKMVDTGYDFSKDGKLTIKSVDAKDFKDEVNTNGEAYVQLVWHRTAKSKYLTPMLERQGKLAEALKHRSGSKQKLNFKLDSMRSGSADFSSSAYNDVEYKKYNAAVMDWATFVTLYKDLVAYSIKQISVMLDIQVGCLRACYEANTTSTTEE